MEIRNRNRNVVKIEVNKPVLNYNGELKNEKSIREIELPVDIPFVREKIEEYIRWVLPTSDRLGIWWLEEQSIITNVYDPEDLVVKDIPSTVLFDDEPTSVPSIVTSEDVIQNDEYGAWPPEWYNWSTD